MAQEEERRKEAEIKVAELEARMAKSVSEAMVRAVKEFKASSKMMNLNIVFGQQTFIKRFELYEDKVAHRVSKLDLSFLEEKVSDEETGPSMAAAILPHAEHAPGPSEPIAEASGPA